MRPRLVEWLADWIGGGWAERLIPPPSLFSAIAVMAMLFVFMRRGRSQGSDATELAATAFWGLLGGIVGARVFYWIQHEYLTDLSAVRYAIVAGGTASWGAYLGIALGLVAYRHWKGLPVLPVLDMAASVAGLGIAIGRLSCFFKGDDYGTLSSLPWSVRFPAGSMPFDAQVQQGILQPGAALSLGVHPVQLYLALNGLVLFGIVSAAWPRLRFRPGLTLLLYLTLYAMTRFTLEFFRGDQVRYTGLNWSVPQLMSVATLTLCLVILVDRRQRLRSLSPEAESARRPA
jgi:phosphatidylglycerol:prolipoprotein diacylglycerol transferase